jgi:death on curing protein
MAPPVSLTACRRELIESALAGPWEGFGQHERYPSLTEKVAVLTLRLVKAHACPDGNKRVGLILASAFLEMFGMDIDAGADEIDHVFRRVAGAEDYGAALADLTQWYGEVMRPLEVEE